MTNVIDNVLQRFKRPRVRAADAAGWLARMRSDTRTAEDEANFERWLAEDPEHEREYLELEILWSDLDGFRDAPAVAALRQTAKIEAQRTAGQIRVRLPRSLPLAAGCALAAAVVALFVFNGPALYMDAAYKTAVGDRQTISLADGSEIVLNTDSILRVHYRPWLREVTLDRGQAYFKVAHSTLRPFDVEAASSRIRAVGTAFDVLLRDDTAEVTLVEGRVEVTDQSAAVQSAASSSAIPGKRAHTELSAGQAVAVMPIGISDVKPASLIKTTAWLEGRLVFENERLQDAIAEVNRYSPVRLVVIDEELAELRLSGVFRAGRAENFVESLRTSFAVEAHQAPDGTLILQPATRPKS